MPHRLRKLIGAVLLLLLVLLWSLFFMSLAQGRIKDAARLWQFGYYVVAGIGWIFPAMLIIRWMEKRPRSSEGGERD